MNVTDQDIALLYSGVVYDAMKQDLGWKQPFVLSNAITPLHGGKIFGPAFTCRGAEVLCPDEIKDNIRIEMLQAMYPGCIKIVANGSRTVAISGDITCLLDARHGAVGCILDGYVRDLDIIRATLPDFSVYGRGCSPLDAFGSWQIVEYQEPVLCSGIAGDVLVRPTDFIFADASGALVIPQEHKQLVLHFSLERYRSEARVRERLKQGDDLQVVYREETRW